MRKKSPEEIEALAKQAVDAAYHLHRDPGPGLPESVYEVIPAKLLTDRGLRVKRRQPVPITFAGVTMEEAFRADLIVEDTLIIELKSVEELKPVHGKQLLTYLRLMDQPLGLIINFGASTFKDGIRRVVNRHENLRA